MTIQSFADYAEAAGISLVDKELTQGEFSSTFTNWLVQVVVPEFLGGEDIGIWTISINQNDSGAPYFSSADGLTLEQLAVLNDAFSALFGDGISIEVNTGKTTKERWYSDLLQTNDTDTNPYNILVTGDETVGGTDGVDGTDGAPGSDAYREGTGGTAIFHPAIDGTGGTDGTVGGTAIILDLPAEPYTSIHIVSTGGIGNAILGGDGGDGGAGGAGGDGSATGGDATNKLGADGGDGGDGAMGGHAIVNGDVNLVYVTGDTDLTVLGGVIGIAGAGGASGAGTGGGADGSAGDDGAGADGVLRAAAFSDRVDVDASALTGLLTISGSDGNDTFIAGSGGSVFYATLGSDTYAAGSGADTFIFTDAAQTDGISQTDSITGFDFVNDNLDFSSIVGAGFALSHSGDTLQIDLDGGGTDMLLVITGLGDYMTGGGELIDLL